ncbi:MAG: DUF3106 domain-containing protein [Phycisphaerae bacterium]
MRRFLETIIILAVLAPSLTALAQPEESGDSVLRTPPAGSIARQLRLKMKLKAASEGSSLAAALNHNRRAWNSLSADQRDEYRKKVLAFREKSPEEQQALLKKYDRLIKLSVEKREKYRRLAKIIRAVVAELTDEQRQELMSLTASKRAARLAEHRNRLIREGVIDLDSILGQAEDEQPTTESTTTKPTNPAP